MKGLYFISTMALVAVLLLMPVATHGQSGQTGTETPPIGQPLAREGDLAVKVVEALGLGSTNDEVEAESMAGSVGIAPRNGWIADYPVTPDIIGEVQDTIVYAADSGRISITRDDALNAYRQVVAEISLPVKSYTYGETCEAQDCRNYPNPTTISNYYSDQGPPVVTYYTPPPDYYYLYGWVPYPFWWSGFWFPGFFVLHDFHKVIIVHNRPVFVTNHFSRFGTPGVFRVDPVQRFNGRTFAGIGAPRSGRFLSTGIERAPHTVFNPGRHQMMQGGGKMTTPSSGGGRTAVPSSRSGGGSSQGGGMRR